MNKIILQGLAGLALVAILSAQAEGGLIRVQFDDFSNTGVNVTALNIGGITLNREVNFSTGARFEGGSIVLDNQAVAILTYTVTNGDFGDLFATSGASKSFFDGFSVNALRNVVGEGQTSFVIEVGGIPVVGSTLSNGDNDFRNVAMPGATTVKFTIANTRPGNAPPGSLVINSLSAVPEPSAMLMVGLLASFGLSRRRRA